MSPLFSIITVCYNSADNLAKTIASVDGQNCHLYEHIIIDGASTDRTSEVLEAADLSRRLVVSEPDHGIYDAMNKGLGRAQGTYLIFLNAGDTFHSEDTLQIYANSAGENCAPDIIYGQTVLVDSEGQQVGVRHLTAPDILTYQSFAYGMLVCHQAMAVKRIIAPLYNTRYRFSADYDWVIKCLQHSRQNIYTGVVVCNYLNEGVTTANMRASLLERFRIMSRFYGLIPTILRHIGFLFRFIKRNKSLNK